MSGLLAFGAPRNSGNTNLNYLPLKKSSKTSPAAKAFKKAKKLSVAYYVKKLDIVFSRFIRQRDGGRCFTCPYQNDWKKLQNGHFCPRQHMATRFDERNNNAQCFACNMFYGGRPDAYALRLQEKYGPGIVKELHDLARTEKHWSIPELQALIEKYSAPPTSS